MRPNRDQANIAIAWGLWLIAQVGVLALFAYRLPVSARFPAPMENAAAVALVLVQMTLAAALAPLLFRDWRSVLCGIASAMPMILLATLLSGQPWKNTVAPLLVSSVWFGVFALPTTFRPAVRVPIHAMLLVLSAGAPVMLYLVTEFAVRPPGSVKLLPWVSPTLGAASTCLHETSNLWFATPPLGILVLGLVLIRLRQGSRPTPTHVVSGPIP